MLNIVNVIRKTLTAMRFLAISTVSTYYYRPRRTQSVRMRPVVTDIPCFVCRSVCRSVVSPTKPDEPIEVTYGVGWAKETMY